MSLRSLLSVLLIVAVPRVALADAVVVVTLRAADGSRVAGTVQLSRGETKHGCTAGPDGRCEIRGVAGGAYTVTVEPAAGRPSPKPRSVMIPPTGEVKLMVNAS